MKNPLTVFTSALSYFFTGVFALLHAYSFLKYIQNFLTKSEFRYFFIAAVTAAAASVFVAVVALTWAGKSCSFVIFYHITRILTKGKRC